MNCLTNENIQVQGKSKYIFEDVFCLKQSCQYQECLCFDYYEINMCLLIILFWLSVMVFKVLLSKLFQGVPVKASRQKGCNS